MAFSSSSTPCRKSLHHHSQLVLGLFGYDVLRVDLGDSLPMWAWEVNCTLLFQGRDPSVESNSDVTCHEGSVHMSTEYIYVYI